MAWWDNWGLFFATGVAVPTPFPPHRSSPVRAKERQRGVSSIEYALLGALIAVAIVVGVAALGTNLEASYSSTASTVGTALGAN